LTQIKNPEFFFSPSASIGPVICGQRPFLSEINLKKGRREVRGMMGRGIIGKTPSSIPLARIPLTLKSLIFWKDF
jgi:hypothetical protein